MVITVGFEGPNRVGKGTQIRLLKDYLGAQNIPVLSVRGDGSRPASGQAGDPISSWWNHVTHNIYDSRSVEIWDRAACRLGRELIIWRDRYLPRIMKLNDDKLGFLLIDRSIISRCIYFLESGGENIDNMYCFDRKLKQRNMGYRQLCPDVIVRLIAPRQTLLDRLQPDDPKYWFRRSLIERPCDWYEKAITVFPPDIQERIKTIESIDTPRQVAERVIHVLGTHFQCFANSPFRNGLMI